MPSGFGDFKPTNILYGIGGSFDCIVNGIINALFRGSYDFDFFVDGV